MLGEAIVGKDDTLHYGAIINLLATAEEIITALRDDGIDNLPPRDARISSEVRHAFRDDLGARFKARSPRDHPAGYGSGYGDVVVVEPVEFPEGKAGGQGSAQTQAAVGDAAGQAREVVGFCVAGRRRHDAGGARGASGVVIGQGLRQGQP